MKGLLKAVSSLLLFAFVSSFAGQTQKLEDEQLVRQDPVNTKKGYSGRNVSDISHTDPALYVMLDNGHETGNLHKILDNLDGKKNIIIYVHGRAAGCNREPKKSLNRLMPDMSTEYNAVVIMFYWPGSADGGPLGFPDERAREASYEFAKTLESLQKYKMDNPERLKDVKLSLILHSMGNIVLEEFMKKYDPKSQERLNEKLFDSVVLSSPAVEAENHYVWLEKVNFTDNLYVTVNNNDLMLLMAGIFRNQRLGRSLEKSGRLAKNAVYVDFSDTGVNHDYFVYEGQNNNQQIAGFYKTVLNGSRFDFSSFKSSNAVLDFLGVSVYSFEDVGN
jgi:hypothetical protein